MDDFSDQVPLTQDQLKILDQLIGQNLRSIRLAKGIPQSELAGAIGITFQQIQKYERGFNRIAGSRMVQIANYLNVPVEILFKGIQSKDWSEFLVPPKKYENLIHGLFAINDPKLDNILNTLVKHWLSSSNKKRAKSFKTYQRKKNNTTHS